MNYRKQLFDELEIHFRNNKNLYLLYGDSGFGGVDKIPDSRKLNYGIAEQSMVGVAAGMAMTGLIPVVYCISNFLVYRALEQIRNDIVLQKLNVKLIGTGAEDYFNFLGKSHTTGNDDIEIMRVIGMQVYDPYDKYDELDDIYLFTSFVDKFINSPSAGYLRV